MKRESNEEHIDDVINRLIKSYGMRKNFDEIEAINASKKVLGPTLVKYIESIQIKKYKLYIKFNSSVIREELLMGKSTLIKLINEQVGKSVVLDIIMV